ncbi:hypothetical protein ACFL0U_01235 [Pseudomonadota bacterium]
MYEGEDCYLKLIDDIIKTCSLKKDEILYIGADDRKSSKKVIEAEKKIYAIGIPSRNLVSTNNNYILGYLKNYRQISPNYFMSNNVVVIYGTKIAFPSVINDKGVSTKTIIINEPGIANQLKVYFNNLWNIASTIDKSSAKQVFKTE